MSGLGNKAEESEESGAGKLDEDAGDESSEKVVFNLDQDDDDDHPEAKEQVGPLISRRKFSHQVSADLSTGSSSPSMYRSESESSLYSDSGADVTKSTIR